MGQIFAAINVCCAGLTHFISWYLFRLFRWKCSVIVKVDNCYLNVKKHGISRWGFQSIYIYLGSNLVETIWFQTIFQYLVKVHEIQIRNLRVPHVLKQSPLWHCLSVKELFAWNKRYIWNFKWPQRDMSSEPLSNEHSTIWRNWVNDCAVFWEVMYGACYDECFHHASYHGR